MWWVVPCGLPAKICLKYAEIIQERCMRDTRFTHRFTSFYLTVGMVRVCYGMFQLGA